MASIISDMAASPDGKCELEMAEAIAGTGVTDQLLRYLLQPSAFKTAAELPAAAFAGDL